MPLASKLRPWLAAAVLALPTAALFWPLCRFGYFAVDDSAYSAQNPAVQAGLTREGIAWAFTSVGYAANWHPLTWLSLMADVELLGAGPRGHHLVNVLLHAVNAVLVLVVFRSLTGALWRSALIAALFAVHPLHVESVAWISERKDVLSACLWLLVLAAYVRYARKPVAARYAAVASGLALGLLAKPMLVTLPFVLLLLDWWPLGRLSRLRGSGAVFLEKAPLLALSAISVGITVLAQTRGGLVAPLAGVSVAYRIANALAAYVRYILKMLWPVNLSFWYPHPGGSLPVWEAAAAGALLLVLSGAAAASARRLPYLAVGWFWYLGTLVPVIGLVQVGAQAMADRYTYLPLLGLFLAVVWGAAVGCRASGPGRFAASVGSLAAVGALSLLTRSQVGVWRDSESVFARAIAATSNNWVMHNNLGELYLEQGRPAEAVPHFQEAVRITPRYLGIRGRLALALENQGLLDEAAGHYRELLRLDPNNRAVLFPLGNIAARQGRPLEAAAYYREVLRDDPGHDGAHNNLATILLQQGLQEEALAHFQEAVHRNPRNAEARNNLGTVLFQRGRLVEAMAQYREAVAARAGYTTAMMGLARVCLAQGNRDEAGRWFREVLRTDPGNAEARARLAELRL